MRRNLADGIVVQCPICLTLNIILMNRDVRQTVSCCCCEESIRWEPGAPKIKHFDQKDVV